jgi:ferredoxin
MRDSQKSTEQRQTEDPIDAAASDRRRFLAGAGAVCASTALVSLLGPTVAQGGAKESFPTTEYDWEMHNWGYGIDANKCIGCLRCVDACKNENGVQKDAHHFRTWVERYVYIEGEKRPRIDSQGRPRQHRRVGAGRLAF